MLAGDVLIAPVPVCQIIALPDVRSELGWIEFGYAGCDGGVDDGGLEFHGVVAEHADYDVEAWVLLDE